jgi:hypothetical protein
MLFTPPVIVDFAFADANRVFALQTPNRDLPHPRK